MRMVEGFRSPHLLSEYDALAAAGSAALDAIPGAVYLCDKDGWLVQYNAEAAELWAREPVLHERRERFCGSHRLFLMDGTPLPHAECPMADAVRTGKALRNGEVVMERPDGSRVIALVNIRALRDHQGKIQGAINCFQDITALKALEADILRKNSDLEDFFENSAVGLHIVSGEGIILRANKAELDLLGYTADEYVGRPVADFHADAPVISDILQRLSCGEGLERYPARLRARDGSIKQVLITSNSRFDDGKFVNTRCFTTDVTDLREAEAARRESDGRLAATYEAATVGIAEVDEAGRYVRVNDSLCKILGRSREEVLATNLVDITHEEDREEEVRLYGQQVRGELPSYSIQKRAVRPDGSVVCLDVFSSSVYDENGRFRYGVRVMQDITDSRRMQEELRASEQRLRDLFEAMPAAIYTTDAEGRVTFYNQAAAALAGREPELGSDQWCVTWRLYWPDGSPMTHEECPMAIALREGRAIRGCEAIAERPDGSRVPFIPFPTPLRDADGNLVGAVNMLVDISERKEAEARQKTLIAELNHRVKNTLATVQSLAHHSVRHAASLEEFSETFQARILALAKAHDLLTRRNWEGANLNDLLQDIVAPYGDGRVKIEAVDFEVRPGAALSLTMVLHELTTNAAKYGALSVESGKLSVRCESQLESESMLKIDWIENGGFEVREPARAGFGTRLIKRCVEKDLAGSVDLQFEPAGLRCSIAIPVTALARE